MVTRRPELTRHARTLGLAAGLTLVLFVVELRAQHTPDPYNIVGEYNSQYEPYMYATYPTVPGMGTGLDRFQSRSGVFNSNAFQGYLSEGDEVADLSRPVPRGMSGPGTPYYRAFRRYDQEFQRTYRPNELADRAFYSNQQQRNDKYFQALREQDPRKRAQLMREYNLENLRSARLLSTGRNATDREREPGPGRERIGRDSLFNRDRLGPSGFSAPLDDATESPSRSTVAPPPTSARGSATSPLPTAPPSLGGSTAPLPSSLRGRTGASPTTGTSGGLYRSGTRTGGATGSLLFPNGTGNDTGVNTRVRTGSRPSSILDRSELYDRALQATSPGSTRSTAPPPP
jgi:hypothetical protein